MLKWLATPTYNRFDPFWLCLSALAWRDQNYFAAIVFVTVGALLSSALEVWSKPATPASGG